MTNIKERILYFIENQGEKKELFFEELGMSYANFKGVQKKSALGSDKIDKILSKYPNLNLDWLFTGQGEMLKNALAPDPTPQESHAGADRYTASLEKQIALLEKNNALLEDKIEDLKRRLEFAEVKDKEEMSLKIKKQRKENKTIIAEKNEIIFAQSEEINALKSRHLPPDKPLRPAQKL